MKQILTTGIITVFLFFLYLLLWGCKEANPEIKVALVSDLMSPQELEKIEDVLKSFDDVSYETISVKELNSISSKKYTHIWIHSTIVGNSGADEIKYKNSIISFLNNGGNLFVSREALFFLNTWGIEKQSFEVESDTITDEGFGRPLGYHAFRSHPLFTGLHGGVYLNKALQDQIVRKIGFFGDMIPSEGKVAGIEWKYITFNENTKLLFEYNVGRGKIIAAGAFLDYSIANFNTLQLNLFTHNVFRYTSGQLDHEGKYFWEYDPQTVNEVSLPADSMPLLEACHWKIPVLSAELIREKGSNDFVTLAGRRILVMGKEKGGIDEIWAHPFMALRDYHVEVILNNSSEIIQLSRMSPKITVSPEMIIREYRLGETDLREIITASFDKPVVVMHYEWDDHSIDKIVIKQTSNLRYMWPYSSRATGKIDYCWMPEINAMLISGDKGNLNSLTSFSALPETYVMGQNDSVKYLPEGRFELYQTDKIQLNSAFVFNANEITGQSLNVCFIAEVEDKGKSIDLLQNQWQEVNTLFFKTNEYYKSLLQNYLLIESPDPVFNESYKWSLLRMNQFIQETPGIGTSLMAGFATTARGWNGNQKISGRPGYAWYFGRDGEWSGMAMDASGNFETVKNILQVFDRYQDVTGKIFHELTSSGAVHYDASDASPLYLFLAAHYLKYSGDIDFIRTIWPGLKKAYDYILSTDTDGDGLIENTNVGHGWTEGGRLFGSHTEFHLAGCQVAAADAVKYIAEALGDKQLSLQAGQFAERTKQIIDREFWNPSGRYFYQGKMKDGSFMDDNSILSAACVYLNAIADTAKAFELTSEYAGNDFTSDWGLRIISEFNPKSNPRTYHEGMVWPLFTGWGSLAEYMNGCYTSGYLHLMQNMNHYREWALGCTPEALNGQIYAPTGVCPVQCWSESMIIQPAIEGMLGLKTDALLDELELAPRFPWRWENANVTSIRMNKTLVDMRMERSGTETNYLITSKGKSATVRFFPEFPLFTTISSVEINGKNVPYTTIERSESICLMPEEFRLKEGENRIVIRHSGGMAALSPVIHAVPGQDNSGVKVISQKADGGKLRIIVRGRPDSDYRIEIFSAEEISDLKGAKVINRVGMVSTIELKTPLSDDTYVDKELILSQQ